MAREFDANAANYLKNTTSAPVTAYPFTVCCWINPDSVAGFKTLVGISDKDSSSNRNALMLSGDKLLGAQNENFVAAQTTGTVGANVWTFVAWAAVSTNEQHLWIGSSKESPSVAGLSLGPSSDSIAVGVLADSSPSSAMDGEIAEVAVWSRQLDDAEVALLAAGFAPSFVQRGLVFYAPLFNGTADDEVDIIGGRTLVETGTVTVTPHPRIVYPSRVRLGVPTAGGGGGAASSWYYRLQQQLAS